MSFALRPATYEDCDFLWSLHRETMRDYVDKTWGWDEQWQHARFLEQFDPGDRQILEVEGHAVGMVQIDRQTDLIFLKNIQITPSYQRRGLGGEIVRMVIGEAHKDGIPIRLQVLKVNPARAFYRRLGFCEIGTTETHVRMERVPRE